jgi:TonB family protein
MHRSEMKITRCSRLSWSILLGALFFARLAAQDILVTDPIWFFPGPAPEEMAKPKSRLRPEYPNEMRKTDETGYVIVTRYIDAGGQSRSLEALGTHMPFQRAVEAEFSDWKFTPAKRAGKAVEGEIWMAVIFNPKSAGQKAPDAKPRLLAATPVVTRDRPTAAGRPPLVPVKLSVDATGAVTAAEPQIELKPATLRAVREALDGWRFAPARKNGQPVAAEIVVPVLCQQPPGRDAGKFTPPRVTSQRTPDYPYSMSRFGLRGEVTLDFDVDVDGKVKNPVVYSSDNPAFDEPAIKAVREWKFQPATRDGNPVKSRQRVPIVFDPGRPGASAFQIDQKSDQSKLPPELHYDTPPRIRGVLVPVYPYEALRDAAKGRAKVMLLIDTQGRVANVKVLSADRPEFGLALTAAVEGFAFDPALRNGKPVPHILNFEQIFNDHEELRDDEADRLLALEKKHPERIVGANKVDSPLKPVSRRSPVFPVTAGPDVTTGDAVIECLVDEEGHARLPRVVNASGPAFGFAAAQAVSTWWFEPPVVGGKPAVVRVQIPFKFAPPKSRKPAGAPNAPLAAPGQSSSADQK